MSYKIKKRKLAGILILMTLLITAAVFLVGKPLLEKKIIRASASTFLDDMKEGYISRTDYDIVSTLYASVTKDWNPTVKSIFENIIGDENSWKRGWKDILKYMEYSIDSIEKNSGDDYLVEITFSNKALTPILTNTIKDISEEKLSFAAGIFKDNAADQFWTLFEKNQELETSTVSETFLFAVRKNKKGTWELDKNSLNYKVYGAIAGLDTRYMALPDTVQSIQNEGNYE